MDYQEIKKNRKKLYKLLILLLLVMSSLVLLAAYGDYRNGETIQAKITLLSWCVTIFSVSIMLFWINKRIDTFYLKSDEIEVPKQRLKRVLFMLGGLKGFMVIIGGTTLFALISIIIGGAFV